MNRSLIIHIVVFLFLTSNVKSQFYNGHQMTFGKSRVQYNDFYWSYYRYDDFDVYFNQNGKNLALYTSDYLNKRIAEIESILDFRIENRIIFVVFNKLTDLRQSNIGLITGQDESNLGGVTTIFKNKVFVYFDGDHKNYKEQIDAAIVKVILNEQLYGSDIKENVANATLINLPEWYTSGLISYISKDWNIEIENIIKDGMMNKRYRKFYHLHDAEAEYAGHCFWKYIADTYGQSIIPEIIYLTRIYKNSNHGFLYSTGMKVKQLSKEWQSYYIDYFKEQEGNFNTTESNPVYKRPKRKFVYHNMKINPQENKLAYVTHKNGRLKIWLYDTNTGKKKVIFKHGHDIEQIVDYTFPAMAWHPSGKILTFITEEEGGLKLYYYKLDDKKLISRNFLYFEKVLDYSFSNDGFKFVMSAVRNSQTDIFVYNVTSSSSEQITNDVSDDIDPKFVDNDNSIIFSSNRIDNITYNNLENYKTDVVYNLYLYDYANSSKILKKLSAPEYSNSTNPFEVDRNQYIFLNDANGVRNRYSATFDSIISFVDTTIHYRYVTQSSPVSNYFRNIDEQDYSNQESGEIIYKKGREFMFMLPGGPYSVNSNFKLPLTKYQPQKINKLKKQDSINHIIKTYIPIDEIKNNKLILDDKDTIELETWDLDINNYIFEHEKINFYNKKLEKKNVIIVKDTLPEKRPRIRIYETAFYPNYLVNQVDFQYTNTSYQAFTGGAVYFSPGMNMLLKVGTNDLFEDYRLIFGYRFTFDFESNEYLLSFENLKTRLDKQFIYHRQAFKNYPQDGRSIIRVQTNEGMYILKYPLNQVFSVKGTLKLRHDRQVYLSIPGIPESLEEPNIHTVWSGAKSELIFDNTRNLGMNLYSGTRWKIFAESYFQVDNKFSNLFVVGADYRYYLPIHRTLILATRFAGSSSFGKNKLIYYLGSVDNWTNFSTRVPTFDQSVPINNREKYSFQTLATNMRGFSQNIRNGNNFALMNTEIRWPIIRYLANRPIGNNFFNNLQVVGFFDIGSAWQGLTPYSGKNAYDKVTAYRKNDDNLTISITIDSNRDPIVAGYGFGFRSMLLGYFFRLDWAWGIENKTVLPRVFYFSLNLDF